MQIDPLEVVLIGCACFAFENASNKEKEFMGCLERGQLPPPELLDQFYATDLIYENVKYRLKTSRTGPSTFDVGLLESRKDEVAVAVEVRALADGGYLVLMGGKSHVAYLKDEVGARRIVVDSQTCLFVDEYDPTTVKAAMGGKLLRFLVEGRCSRP